jgi:hypothetical protein
VSGGELWRVGHRDDPLAFTRLELCEWNHRFDDARRRFRTIYCAEDPRTSLREVLADFRPKLSAIRAFADAFGEGALDDLLKAAGSNPAPRYKKVLTPAGGWVIKASRPRWSTRTTPQANARPTLILQAFKGSEIPTNPGVFLDEEGAQSGPDPETTTASSGQLDARRSVTNRPPSS